MTNQRYLTTEYERHKAKIRFIVQKTKNIVSTCLVKFLNKNETLSKKTQLG